MEPKASTLRVVFTLFALSSPLHSPFLISVSEEALALPGFFPRAARGTQKLPAFCRKPGCCSSAREGASEKQNLKCKQPRLCCCLHSHSFCFQQPVSSPWIEQADRIHSQYSRKNPLAAGTLPFAHPLKAAAAALLPSLSRDGPAEWLSNPLTSQPLARQQRTTGSSLLSLFA